jgi:hypothetical protein
VATPAKAEATPATAKAPPAMTEATPAKAEATPAKAEAPPATAEAPPAKAEAPPATAEAPPAAAEAPPAKAEAPPATAEAPPAKMELPPDTTRGGTIAGTITGRLDLVEEVVVLGPDSLLRQFARVKLTTSAGRASFQVGSVPPGRYAVTPMGARGASLSARPAAARVIVTAEVGARADFEIVGAL